MYNYETLVIHKQIIERNTTICGVIGAFNFPTKNAKTKKKTDKSEIEYVNKYIINQLEDQIDRGKEGFGVLFIDDKNNIKLERSCEIAKTIVDLYMNKSKMIVLHHRTPTSSKNKINQTHPIVVDNGSLQHKYYIIHNGIISNAEELKKEHEKLGFIYTTNNQEKSESEYVYTNEIGFNDSESFAIELARYIEKQTDIVSINGSTAFIAIQASKKTGKALKILYGRNDSNPLNMSGSRGKIRISSEGEGVLTKKNTIYEFDLKEFKIKKDKLKIKEASLYEYEEYEKSRQWNKITDSDYDKSSPKEIEAAQEDIDIIIEEEIEEKIEQTTDKITEATSELFEKIKNKNQIFNIDIDKDSQELAKKILVAVMECHKSCQDSHVTNIVENVETKEQEIAAGTEGGLI